MSIRETRVDDFAAYQIQTEGCEVTLCPELGGKLTSIRNPKTGREWLWQSPYLPYRRGVYGESYIKSYDTGGFDECFPTVDPCTHPQHPWQGVAIPDHGEVFSQSWRVIEASETATGEVRIRLAARGVRFPYEFRRELVCGPDECGFRLRYEVDNFADFPLPYLWSSHPIIKIEPGMQLEFPAETPCKVGFAVDDDPAVTGDAFIWPELESRTRGPLDLGVIPDPEDEGFEPFGIKLFAGPLQEGWTQIWDPGKTEGLRFEFPLEPINHVAMWLNYGKWSGAETPPYFNMAYEPVIGPCDALDIAIRYHHCAAVIPPGEQASWELRVSIPQHG